LSSAEARQAGLKTIVGRDKVSRFYLAIANKTGTASVRVALLNGLPSLIVDIPSSPRGWRRGSL
jgi:hypothetical protein